MGVGADRRHLRRLYHVLGGTLKALDGIGPEELGVDRLLRRVEEQGIAEVILALSATVDGQTTSHYLAERLQPLGCTVSRLGHGVPVGGELTYLDEGTLDAALRARQRGRLTVRRQVLTSRQLFTPATSYRTMALLEILQAAASRPQDQGQAGDPASTTGCAGLPPTCSRPCTRRPASASPLRRSASCERSGRPRRRRRRGADVP